MGDDPYTITPDFTGELYAAVRYLDDHDNSPYCALKIIGTIDREGYGELCNRLRNSNRKVQLDLSETNNFLTDKTYFPIEEYYFNGCSSL
ncbi:MAG: hypothetical protein IJS09_03925, partial [Treponema sp.]|nr:hypothetical protein [Treponema sp.]